MLRFSEASRLRSNHIRKLSSPSRSPAEFPAALADQTSNSTGRPFDSIIPRRCGSVALVCITLRPRPVESVRRFIKLPFFAGGGVGRGPRDAWEGLPWEERRERGSFVHGSAGDPRIDGIWSKFAVFFRANETVKERGRAAAKWWTGRESSR